MGTISATDIGGYGPFSLGVGIGANFFPGSGLPAGVQRQESYRNPNDGSGYDIIRGYTADDGPSGGAFGIRVNLRGPRLLNLNVAFSLYGIPIPISFGVRRLSGNLLWANALSERRDKEKKYINPPGAGGSGFQPGFALQGLNAMSLPSSAIKLVTYTYYYFGDFAVGFGYGDPALDLKVVSRIWANGKLIYDMGNGNIVDPAFRLAPARYFPTLRFRFYPGTEDQLPDPFIQSVENKKYAEENSLPDDSVNIVPAYRGQMYVVFEKFPLGPFNNSIPDIQVELTDSVEVADFDDDYGGIDTATPDEDKCGIGVDWNAGVLFSVINGTLYHIDISSNAVTFALPLAPPGDEAYRVYAHSPMTGKMYMSVKVGTSAEVHYFDPFLPTGIVTGTVIGNLSTGPYSLPIDTIDKICPVPYFDQAGFIQDGVFVQTNVGGTNIFLAPSPNPIYVNDAVTWGLIPGPVTDLVPTMFLIPPDNDNILKYGPDTNGGFTTFYTPSGTVQGAIWVPAYSYLMIIENPTIGTGRVKAMTMDGNILWTSETFANAFSELTTEDSMFYLSDTTGPTFVIPSGGRIVELDIATGKTVRNRSLLGVSGGHFQVTSANNQAVYGLQNPMYYDKPFFGRTNLKDFIEFAGDRAGLDPSEISVSDTIGDILIDGAYIIARDLSFRALLKNLQQAFLFDIRESDDVLEIFKRDEGVGATDFAFTSTDLLITNQQTDVAVDANRSSDDQVPRMVYYRFLDFNMDYQENVMIAQRSDFPTATSNSKTTLEISTPIIMRASEAKAWAIKVLYSLWSARNAYAFMLRPEAYKFEPGDAGTVEIGTDVYSVKIERVIYNANFSMSVNAVSFRTDFPIEVSTDDPRGERQTLGTYAASYPFALDIPNPFPNANDLVNSNQGRGALLKAYAGPSTAGTWLGGNIIIVYNGVTNDLGSIDPDVAPKLAFTTAEFASPEPELQWSTDEVNELTLKFIDSDFDPSGTLTYEQWISGAYNVIVLGSSSPYQEIVVARECEDNGDGTFTFRTFMRGYRGTDQAIQPTEIPNDKRWTHPVSTRATYIFPDATKDTFLDAPPTPDISLFGFGFASSSVLVAATSAGGLELLPPRNTTYAFYGMQARPFSVVGVTAIDDGGGNLVITFERRSRAPDPWADDGDDDGPDAWESIEEFGVRFYADNGFGDLTDTPINTSMFLDDKSRGVSGGDNYTFTLDAAARTTYLGGSSMPTVVYVKIVQRSEVWGDGVPRYASVNVTAA